MSTISMGKTGSVGQMGPSAPASGAQSTLGGAAWPTNASLASGAYDADIVVYRMEEAGATLLALPGSGWSTRLRTSSLEIVRTALESYGWTATRIRPAVPGSAKVDRMDEAMGWLGLISQDNYMLRRVVGARSLVHPITDRHLFTWRRLGAALGADHKAVQRWHAQGIDLIVAALNRGLAPRKSAAKR